MYQIQERFQVILDRGEDWRDTITALQRESMRGRPRREHFDSVGKPVIARAPGYIFYPDGYAAGMGEVKTWTPETWARILSYADDIGLPPEVPQVKSMYKCADCGSVEVKVDAVVDAFLNPNTGDPVGELGDTVYSHDNVDDCFVQCCQCDSSADTAGEWQVDK